MYELLPYDTSVISTGPLVRLVCTRRSALGGPEAAPRIRCIGVPEATRMWRPVRRGKILKISRFKFQAPSPTFQAPGTEGKWGIWKIMDA